MPKLDFHKLEARWRADPDNTRAREVALSAFRQARVDAPLDLLRASPDWKPVIDLARTWFRRPLGPSTGYTTAELDELERSHDAIFPPTAREWWRLAGKHECCGEWGDTFYGYLLRPDGDEIRRGNLL